MEDISADSVTFEQRESLGAGLLVHVLKALMIAELTSHIVKLLSSDGEMTRRAGHGSCPE